MFGARSNLALDQLKLLYNDTVRRASLRNIPFSYFILTVAPWRIHPAVDVGTSYTDTDHVV